MNTPNYPKPTIRGDAEETLRLVAGLPAPEGLEDRVHAALAKAPRSARILRWPLGARWMHSTMARSAAAAAIVCVVAGGGWQVYSRVRPPEPKVIAMPRMAAPGGFSSANAIRTPKTLNGPTLTHPIGPEQRSPAVPPKKSTEAKKQGKSGNTHATQAVAR